MLKVWNLHTSSARFLDERTLSFLKIGKVNKECFCANLKCSKFPNFQSSAGLSTSVSNKLYASAFQYRISELTFWSSLQRGFELRLHEECMRVLSGNVQARLMAGHAKWQNVKHVKAEKDRIKAVTCSKYAHLARNAVREKGPDPKVNEKLAIILEEARKHNVPLSTLEKAMKSGSNTKMKSGFIEISGPSGSFVIIDYETDNISTIRHEIKQVLKRYSSVIIQGEGRWRAVFDRKGIVKVVGTTTGESLDKEKALDAAIEVGAEDVLEKNEESGEKMYLEFYCATDELHNVKKELEKKCFEIEEAYVGFIPNLNVDISPADADLVGNMLSELEDIEGVVRIYENVRL